MDNFNQYLLRAKVYHDRGTISVAEALAFFHGSDLPTDILLEIADDNIEGILGWEEFKIAVRLALRRQHKKTLKSEIEGGGRRGGGGVLSYSYPKDYVPLCPPYLASSASNCPYSPCVGKDGDKISVPPTHDDTSSSAAEVVLPYHCVPVPYMAAFSYPYAYHNTCPSHDIIDSEGE
ncbi:hypothetical protein OROHE_011645 [Orobanche hederae]